ncbi:MAG TPA: UDP-2,3-diacylglucosamine diphosphatase LpxI [Candidatus Omnitrophota bacterium]|nr:UDP-2,3-diacylglucosamine diphosphatase LpxI [Candidatus Omnitrophota bacterium]HPT39714.1 UDP-2,3-diacylglucosamine diphosphatase LpxI [Candidatus Omnitrophota bacterium]
MKKIGLIAGNRKFPLLFAASARKKGCKIIAVAIKGDTSPKLKKLVDKIYWLKLSEFRKMFDIFKSEAVEGVVMAGQISPRRLFSKETQFSPELKQILDTLKDKKADTLFGAVAQRLEAAGLTLLDSTTFVEEYLPKKSTLTKLEPDFDTWEDIYFGLSLAKAVASLDIGQTVAVKSKAIVAVEAFEGTDNLIRRSGKVGRGKVVIVKVSKPKQDMRFDIPVVGLNTVKNLVRAKCKCLAFEAGKTLFIDRKESIRLADKKGLIIVAV